MEVPPASSSRQKEVRSGAPGDWCAMPTKAMNSQNSEELAISMFRAATSPAGRNGRLCAHHSPDGERGF